MVESGKVKVKGRKNKQAQVSLMSIGIPARYASGIIYNNHKEAPTISMLL